MVKPRELALAYFQKNPDKLNSNYGKIALHLGVSYDTVRRAANQLKTNELSNVVLSESITKSNTDGYSDKNELENTSLESYCKAYGIPYEYVTSAKFVNHNGQEAWNVVCDIESITPAYLDKYLEELKAVLTKEITPYQLPKAENNSAAYHNYLADMHVGAANKSNDLYDNKYNAKIFKERLMSTLIPYVEEGDLRSRFTKYLHVDLGDAVNSYMGKTTRGVNGSSTHKLHENLTAPEIFDVYVDAMKTYWDKVIELNLADEYEFIAITNDNHGGAFGYVVNRAVEIYLNIKYPEIKTTVERKFISQYEWGMHTFLFTHGKDEEEMKFPFPLNLNEKVVAWLYQYIRKKGITNKYVHVVKGDLHQENTNTHEHLRYRNCLSLYGSNSWSMLNFGFTPSGHSYEVVYKDKPKVFSSYNTFN